MGRQRLIGVHVQTRLADDIPELPEGSLVLLKDAVDAGTLHMSDFWRKRNFFQEHELDEWRNAFEQHADGNAALTHLQMACFLMQLCSDTLHRHFRRRQIDRYFIVLAIVQRELTLACLALSSGNLKHIAGWWKVIGLKRTAWMTSVKGANSVARVAHILMQEGIEVYLPTAAIDTDWKIDLIAYCPRAKHGMCIQIKTIRRKRLIWYHLANAPTKEPHGHHFSNEQRFKEGVARFRAQNRGIWTSVKLAISSISYETGSIIPCNSMLDAMREMILDVFTDPCPTL